MSNTTPLLRMTRSVLLIASLCFLCSACSPRAEIQPLPAQIADIELFMSRGSLSKMEFETYKLQGDSLFVECGPVVGGRFQANQQEFIALGQEGSDALFESARSAIELYNSRDWLLDEPGRSNSFFDPGQFYLTAALKDGTNITLKTSLDTISEPKSRLTSELRELAIMLRGSIGSPPCSNRSFYGLPTQQRRIQPTRIS